MPDIPITLDFNGGVNLLADPRRVADNECTYLQNLAPTVSGMISKRKGLAPIKSLVVFQSITGAYMIPTCLMIPNDPLMPRVVACGRNQATNQGMLAIEDEVVAGSCATSNWPTMPLRTPQLVYFVHKIYAFGGVGTVLSKIISNSGPGLYTFSDFIFSGTGNSDLLPAVATVYRKRMVYGDFGPGYENYILFSDDYSPQIVGDNALSTLGVQVGDEGERVTALVNIMLTDVGTPAQSALLVLKEFSAYLLTGEPDQHVSGGDLLISKMSVPAGCAGWTSVVRTPFGVMWAGPDDIWVYTTGAVPRRIGRKISPRLVSAAASGRFRWHAGYANNMVRFAIPAAGQDVSSDTAVGEQWWLDLSEGLPPQVSRENDDIWQNAHWFGPQIIKDLASANVQSFTGTFCMASDSTGPQARLVGATSNSYTGALGLYAYDMRDGYDETIELGVNEQFDNEIDIAVRTKEYDLGAPTKMKRVVRAELDLWTSQTSIIRCFVYANGGEKRYVLSRDSNDLAMQPTLKGFIVGADTLNIDWLTRQFQTLVAYPDAAEIVQGARLQLLLTEEFARDMGAVAPSFKFILGGVTYTVAFAVGVAGTLQDYMDGLVARMNAAGGGGTFTHNIASQTHGVVVITHSTTAWTFDFSERSTRIHGSRMGYQTGSNPVAATVQTAVDYARWRISTAIDLASTSLHVRLIPRGPV